MKLMAKINGVLDRIINLLAFIAGAIVIFVMLLVSSEVVTRYFLGTPIPGVVEITEISILWICFLAAAWIGVDGHVKMDIVVNRLPQRARTWLSILTAMT